MWAKRQDNQADDMLNPDEICSAGRIIKCLPVSYCSIERTRKYAPFLSEYWWLMERTRTNSCGVMPGYYSPCCNSIWEFFIVLDIPWQRSPKYRTLPSVCHSILNLRPKLWATQHWYGELYGFGRRLSTRIPIPKEQTGEDAPQC